MRGRQRRGEVEVTAAADSSLLLTVSEAARVLSISRNLAYELVARGDLPAVRPGRVIRVPRHGLEQWIARQSGLPDASPPVVSLNPQLH
jgi:excisionase family DNA binding protein